ncbi:MAG: hypothetical protein IKS93_05425 [Methanobrevibacter sp.]|nr:hypothetical protein [Methanobrevibacter sp.]
MWVDKYGFEIFQPTPDTLSEGDHEVPDEPVQEKPAEKKQEDSPKNLPLF